MHFFGQHIINIGRKMSFSSNNNIAKILKLVSLGAIIFLLGLYMKKIYQVPVHYSKLTVKGPNLKYSDMVRGQSVKLSFFKDYSDDNGYRMWFPDSCLSMSIIYVLHDSIKGDYFTEVMELEPIDSDNATQTQRIKSFNEQNLYSNYRAFYNYEHFVSKELPLDSLLYAFNIEYVSTKRNLFSLSNEFLDKPDSVYFYKLNIEVPKGQIGVFAKGMLDSLGIDRANLDINQLAYEIDTIPEETKNHLIQNSFIYISKKDSVLYLHKTYQSADQKKPNLFLTAEDISQCIEILDLSLEPLPGTSPLSQLTYTYGGTAIFSGLVPKPDSVFVNGFMYFKEDKLSIIAKNGLCFYVSLPDMQNRQDFRIYFVTTLIALFLGIFCSVFHELIRNKLMKGLSCHKTIFITSFIFILFLFVIFVYIVDKNSSVKPYELDYKSIGNHLVVTKDKKGRYNIEIEARDSLYRMDDTVW